MSGVFSECSGGRFSRRIWFLEIFMRAFASLLIRPSTHAVRLFRTRSSSPEAEFPPATQSFLTYRGLRAADRASYDALRPNINSVKTEHSYAYSNIRETTPLARWSLPTRWRKSSEPPGIHPKSAGEKTNALAENCRLLQRRRRQAGAETRGTAAHEWFAVAIRIAAAAGTPRAHFAQA